MRLQSLTLQNFRNYDQLHIDFSNTGDLLGFVGNNAQGKTNLIEAISVLALAKSFRDNDNNDLITYDNDFFRIQARIEHESEDTNELEIFHQSKPKMKRVFKINGVSIPTMKFIGNLYTTIFSIDDKSVATIVKEISLDIQQHHS